MGPEQSSLLLRFEGHRRDVNEFSSQKDDCGSEENLANLLKLITSLLSFNPFHTLPVDPSKPLIQYLRQILFRHLNLEHESGARRAVKLHQLS